MTGAPVDANAREASSYDPNEIPDAVREAVSTAFSAVPHVCVDTISWNMMDRGTHPVPINADTYNLHVLVRGWSPSGHAAVIYYDARLDVTAEREAAGNHAKHDMIRSVMVKDTALGVRMLVSLALAGFANAISQQRDRQRRAEDRGHHSPLAVVPMEGMRGHGTEISHIVLDRGIAALIDERAEADGRDARLKIVDSMIADIHANHNTFDYEVATAWPGAVEAMVHDGPPAARLRVKMRLSDDVSICDNVVDVRQPLPDAIATAAVGRPLGDLVAVTPAIAGRIVADVRSWGTMTSIVLEVDEVEVKDLWRKA